MGQKLCPTFKVIYMTDLQKLETVVENYKRFTQAEQRVLEYKAKAERTTRPLQEVCCSGHMENWRENAIIQLIEERDKLADVLNEYIDSWQEAHTVLDKIEDPSYYEVLFRRYIQGYSWKKIAGEMKCSQRNCMLIHEKAIEYLSQ